MKKRRKEKFAFWYTVDDWHLTGTKVKIIKTKRISRKQCSWVYDSPRWVGPYFTFAGAKNALQGVLRSRVREASAALKAVTPLRKSMSLLSLLAVCLLSACGGGAAESVPKGGSSSPTSTADTGFKCTSHWSSSNPFLISSDYNGTAYYEVRQHVTGDVDVICRYTCDNPAFGVFSSSAHFVLGALGNLDCTAGIALMQTPNAQSQIDYKQITVTFGGNHLGPIALGGCSSL